MRISAAGNKPFGPHRPFRLAALARAGFTLLELLVVLSIVAIATAGATLALRDPAQALLQRDAERLAVLLESGRAVSRTRGVTVVWHPQGDGFRFEGVSAETLPQAWLDNGTRAQSAAPIVLGPEPIIGPQEIILTHSGTESGRWRVVTDGLRPFSATPADVNRAGAAS